MVTVAANDIGRTVTVLEAIGVGVVLHRLEHDRRHRRARCSVGKHATGGARGDRGTTAATINGGAARSASCLTGGVSPGTDARSAREEVVGIPEILLLYYVRCIVKASRTAATACRPASCGSMNVTCPPG